MSSIAIKIALHGLIALVPTTESDGVNYMTALLLDARMPHIMADCPSEHQPQLKFLVQETSECTDAGCDASGNQCTCSKDDLAGKHISLRFDPAPNFTTQRLDNSPPVNALPSNPDEAGQFSYIANLAQAPFGLTLAPEYLGASPPSKLLARMRVPLQAVTACALATREDAGQNNVHTMSFRKLHDPSQKDEVSQALAQKVILGLEVPQETKVSLHISDFDGLTNDHPMVLLATSKGYKIDLANQPDFPLDRDNPCNDNVARHFAMYYDLAQNPPELSKRLLPHFRLTQHKSEDGLKIGVCEDPVFGLINRPACPVATFNP